MAPQTFDSSLAAKHEGKMDLSSFMLGDVIAGGFESEECEPISVGQFKVLMALIAVATFVFGCIVNGWLR